jgi:nicotinate phosphoribosyltransferase
MKFSRASIRWLQSQIDKLANVTLSPEELQYLRKTCPYFNESFLQYIETFRLNPKKQVLLSFRPISDTGNDDDLGDIDLQITGLWVETIPYEIPLLALISECYFRFMDRDWNYDGQFERAKDKGLKLLEDGCIFSEFGSRRRRDYHTQDLVIQGLKVAQEEAAQKGWKGELSGTSNVHFAMKHGLPPVGTVAHEWFMGIAAITGDYENANEASLRYWVATFGEGVLGVALTDTFGTRDFLKAFSKPIPNFTSPDHASVAQPSANETRSNVPATDDLSNTAPPIEAPIQNGPEPSTRKHTYAQVFAGVRQDSGDPEEFVKLMRDFYTTQQITDKKMIVFSDSLNVDLCFKYRRVAEMAGFLPSFGVGTFLTNDFVKSSSGKKSVPLNIVIKLSEAGGNPAVKISDNLGKNTGDKATVEEVKRRLGYTEREWKGGDESNRWG